VNPVFQVARVWMPLCALDNGRMMTFLFPGKCPEKNHLKESIAYAESRPSMQKLVDTSNGLLSPDLAASIRRVKGAKKLGIRLGIGLPALKGAGFLKP
jgi:hypothetical protein